MFIFRERKAREAEKNDNSNEKPSGVDVHQIWSSFLYIY